MLSLSFPRPFVLDIDGNRASGVGFRIVVGAELIGGIVDRLALAIVQREGPASP